MVAEWRLQILDWRQTEDGAKGKKPPQMSEPPAFVGDELAKAATADLKAQTFMRRQQAIEARQQN